MSQPRRTIEQLLIQGRLPIKQADMAAIHLEVYPSKRSWLDFFDKAALIIGVIALALALVFFIAYNWQDLGKIGKFALVEGALAITIALYVALSFRQRFKLIRQLLLLIASVITGSLLALFGQVYQTGADTWQLFFGWAVLIIPWVVIARFPALWLLWLGLFNAGLILYSDVVNIAFIDYDYQSVFWVALLTLVNFVALNLWLLYVDRHFNIISAHNSTDTVTDTATQEQSSLHWSTYIVGLVSTCFASFLAIITIFDETTFLSSLITFLLWASWCGFIYWRFYKRDISLLVLTYLCVSIITVAMFWAIEILPTNFDAGVFFILAMLLIGMSSAAVFWLRGIANLVHSDEVAHKGSDLTERGSYE